MSILIIGTPHSETVLQNEEQVLCALGMQGTRIIHPAALLSASSETSLFAAIKISIPDENNELLMAALMDYLHALGEQCPPVVLDAITAAHWLKTPLFSLPKTTLLPLNLAELSQLSGIQIDHVTNQTAAVKQLLEKGISAILVKDSYTCIHTSAHYDYFCQTGEQFWLSHPEWQHRHTMQGMEHLFTLTAAVALAKGHIMNDAVVIAAALSTCGMRLAQYHGHTWQPYLPTAIAPQTWPFIREDIPHLHYHCTVVTQPRIARCETQQLGIYPVVDSLDWLKKLVPLGIQTIQLRLKAENISSPAALEKIVCEAIHYCRTQQVRLFINDHWEWAIQYQAYGIHLGQEDLDSADLQAIANSGCKLGVSTHCYTEVARALAVDPSYIALGPIFATTSKQMPWIPQGVAAVTNWVQLLGDEYPLVAIGGIDKIRAAALKATGVGSVAMISAITQAPDYQDMTRQLLALWED